MQVGDGIGHVVGVEPARHDQPSRVDDAFGQPPVEDLARPRDGAVDEHVSTP